MRAASGEAGTARESAGAPWFVLIADCESGSCVMASLATPPRSAGSNVGQRDRRDPRPRVQCLRAHGLGGARQTACRRHSGSRRFEKRAKVHTPAPDALIKCRLCANTLDPPLAWRYHVAPDEGGELYLLSNKGAGSNQIVGYSIDERMKGAPGRGRHQQGSAGCQDAPYAQISGRTS
jgi:hypothetical protein